MWLWRQDWRLEPCFCPEPNVKHKLACPRKRALSVFNITVILSLLWWVVFGGFGNCPFEVLSCATRELSWLHQIYPHGSYNLTIPHASGPDGSLDTQWLRFQDSDIELGEATSFILSSKQPSSWPQKETSRAIACYKHKLESFYGWPMTLALRSSLNAKPCPPYLLLNSWPDVIETGSLAFPKSNTSSFPVLAASSDCYSPKHLLMLNIFLSHQVTI